MVCCHSNIAVDVNKGMQAQTLECVVIGEAVMAKSNGTNVIVVLNKVGKTQSPATGVVLPLKQFTWFTSSRVYASMLVLSYLL